MSPGKAVSAVVSALRSVSVTDEQVAGAKNRLLADVYSVMENPLEMVEDMGVQVSYATYKWGLMSFF